jgi:hypothetical protein
MALFAAGLRQTKAALSMDKADLSSLPADKKFSFSPLKQVLGWLLVLYHRKRQETITQTGGC